MISGINPWFPILSIKILEYAFVFQNVFIDSIIEQAALKTRKLFLFQLLHVKLDVNPLSLHVTYILSLYLALFYLCVLFFVLNNVTFTNVTNHNDYHKIR